MDNREFEEKFDKIYGERVTDLDKHINIAVVGKVSSGKSSLINAILERDRFDPISPVGSISGVTTKVTPYRLDEQVLIIDCPGLDDVRKENSEETTKFLQSIDLGLFVVTGSSDATQKGNYEDLKKHCKKSIFILNKIDEWDKEEESEYEKVLAQWKSDIGVGKIFGTCAFGYNPKARKDIPMDIRGVDELRKEIFDFLDKEGTSILLAKNLKNKDPYAVGIIVTALVAVAAEAFIPGSAVYITATQATSIVALQYLYTGKMIDKTSVLPLIGSFAGQSIGMNLFLWAKSFLPPTGIVDVAAAGVAITVTFAMLATVKWLLENNYKLENSDELKHKFEDFKKIGAELKKIQLSDFKNRGTFFDLVTRLLSAA